MDLDVAHSEHGEGQLSAFIAHRHEKRVAEEGERRAEEIWQESVRRYHEREREQNRWAWVRHFDLMAANHAKLAEEYERRASELCENGHKKGEA